MPLQTYNMNFSQNDFFYNTSDTNANADLLATFPFKQDAVIQWANQVNPDAHITSITDIFDPKISGIIMNPDFDFGNTFLPGNMTINSNFNKLTFDLTNPPASLTDMKKSTPIKGRIVVSPPGKNSKALTLDISSGNINWTQDSTNSWKPNVTVNTKVSTSDVPFTDTDGGTSYLTINSKNPRCKYRPVCTLNHWHYSGGCKTKTFTDGVNTWCKCQCSGTPTFDSNPHSHCDPYKIKSDGTATGPTGKQNEPGSLGLVQQIQGLKLNITGKFPTSPYGAAGGNITMGYLDQAVLEQNDANIRKMVCDYYAAVYNNIELQKSVRSNTNIDGTMTQTLKDANVQYKTQYLNVFNIVVGIFCASGYIYIMAKD